MSRRNPDDHVEHEAGWYESGLGWDHTGRERYVRWYDSKTAREPSIRVEVKHVMGGWDGSYADLDRRILVRFWYEKNEVEIDAADRKKLGLIGWVRLEESLRILFG